MSNNDDNEQQRRRTTTTTNNDNDGWNNEQQRRLVEYRRSWSRGGNFYMTIKWSWVDEFWGGEQI
jgi:hypothetical protein